MLPELAKPEEAPEFFRHLTRLIEDSGEDGVIYSPREKGEFVMTEEVLQASLARWRRPVHELGWERVWLARVNGSLAGHILLRSSPLRAARHRVELQMGFQSPFRGKGLGGKLIEFAIEWAKQQEALVWMDLGVFACNERAIHLYSKHGFKQTGRVTDRFRVRGQSIDDLSFTLKLR